MRLAMKPILRALLVSALSAQGMFTVAQAHTVTRTSSFEYDPVTGLLNAEVIEPDNGQYCVRTAYVRDVYGNKVQSTVSNCGASVPASAQFPTRTTTAIYASTLPVNVGGTTYLWAPAGVYAAATTNALNHSDQLRYDPRFGAVAYRTSPNDLVSTASFDVLGRPILEVRADNTRTATYYCFIGGRVSDISSNSAECAGLAVTPPADAVRFTQAVPQAGNGTQNGPWTRVFYDSLDREIRSETQSFDASGAARIIAKHTRYNAHGVAEMTTQPYFTDTGSSNATGTAAYGRVWTQFDAFGRPTASYVSDPQGSQASVTFPDGVTQPAARVQITYNGLSTVTVNDKNQTRTEEKNAAGQIVRTTDASGAQLSHKVDALGNVVETLDALGNRIMVSYDLRGRKTQMVDPDSGSWLYTYNALGELTAQSSPKQQALGQATTLAYDKLGRLTQRTEQEYITNWYYDAYANASACAYGIGKLCEVKTSHGVGKRYTFDLYGRLSTTVHSVSGGPSYTATQTYDSAKGWLKSQIWPTGIQVNYNRTALGFLQSLTHASSGNRYWLAESYNAWGKPESVLYANNVRNRAYYDPMTGRATESNAGQNAATDIQRLRTTWDSVGNLISKIDDNGAGNGQAVTETYWYDSINRLQKYQVASPAIAPAFNREVTLQYNAVGNLLFKSDVGVYAYPASGSPRPHAVQSVNGSAYNYDANGNLVQANAGSYRKVSYTSFNLPDGSEGLEGKNGIRYTWQYGPDHERIKETKVSGGGSRVTWSFHPDNVGGLFFEQEVAPNGTKTNRHYLVADNGTVVLTTQGDIGSGTEGTVIKSEHWHKDHLGSVVAITNESGAVIQRMAYDPFGKRRFADGNVDASGSLIVDHPNGSDRGFTGHEHLDDVGVIHMNGRIYDPKIGRFMQADPFIQSPHNLQNINRYSYVLNNPLNATDPSGHFVWLLAMSMNMATTSMLVTSMGGLAAMSATQIFIAGAMGGLMGGMISGADDKALIRGAIASGFSAVASYQVGEALGHGPAPSPALNSADFSKWMSYTAAHSAVGCAAGEISGGGCGAGAAGSGVAAGSGFMSNDHPVQSVYAIRMMIGGLAIEAAGGKFANGALSAAFTVMFNDNGGNTKNDKECVFNGCTSLSRLARMYNYGFRTNSIVEDMLFSEDSPVNIALVFKHGKYRKIEVNQTGDIHGEVSYSYGLWSVRGIVDKRGALLDWSVSYGRKFEFKSIDLSLNINVEKVAPFLAQQFAEYSVSNSGLLGIAARSHANRAEVITESLKAALGE